MNTIELECPFCNNKFEKSLSQYNNSIKRNRKMYCSRECRDNSNKKQQVEYTCAQCHTLVLKNQSQIKESKSGNHFCSSSCAATFNNKIAPKRTPAIISYCPICKNRKKTNSNICSNCFANTWKIKTVEQIDKMYLRQIARNIYFSLHPNDIKCEKCGYDKYIEVCHIKPIKDFPPNSLLSEINDETNLIGLCRNCHWELDHNV